MQPFKDRAGFLRKGLIRLDALQLLEDHDECTICLDPYISDLQTHMIALRLSRDPKSLSKDSLAYLPDNPVQLRACGHQFGHKCIRVWTEVHNTCPMCRARLFGPDPNRTVLSINGIPFRAGPAHARPAIPPMYARSARDAYDDAVRRGLIEQYPVQPQADTAERQDVLTRKRNLVLALASASPAREENTGGQQPASGLGSTLAPSGRRLRIVNTHGANIGTLNPQVATRQARPEPRTASAEPAQREFGPVTTADLRQLTAAGREAVRRSGEVPRSVNADDGQDAEHLQADGHEEENVDTDFFSDLLGIDPELPSFFNNDDA